MRGWGLCRGPTWLAQSSRNACSSPCSRALHSPGATNGTGVPLQPAQPSRGAGRAGSHSASSQWCRLYPPFTLPRGAPCPCRGGGEGPGWGLLQTSSPRGFLFPPPFPSPVLLHAPCTEELNWVCPAALRRHNEGLSQYRQGADTW